MNITDYETYYPWVYIYTKNKSRSRRKNLKVLVYAKWIYTLLNVKKEMYSLCCTVSPFVIQSTHLNFLLVPTCSSRAVSYRCRSTILFEASNCGRYYSQHVPCGALKWDKLLNTDWLCLYFIWELDVLPTAPLSPLPEPGAKTFLNVACSGKFCTQGLAVMQ
jgi:hypothetical protein